MLEMPLKVVLSAVVLTAGLTDWRDRRIPNWLTLPAIPAGVICHAIYGDGLLQSILGALVAFVPFFVVFAAGGGGAGDVKLFTAVGAFVGLRNLLPVFVLVGLIGGLVALVMALRLGALGRVLGNLFAILTAAAGGRWDEFRALSDVQKPGGLRLAYGVVIAAGTLLFLWFPNVKG
ncbi:MAG: prepilin peptidase [Bryobacteraceae bacterium]